MKYNRLLTVVLSGAAVITVLVFYSFPIDKPASNSFSSSEFSSEVVFPVQTTIAHKGNLIKSLQTNGTLCAKREVEIIARVGGEITRVVAHNGVYVHSGEELVKLDDREYRLAYEKASNALLGAQIDYKTFSANVAVAGFDTIANQKKVLDIRRKLSEVEDNFKKGSIGMQEYLRLKRDLETDLAYATLHREDVMAGKSGLSQARESFERAKLDFEATTIKAPFDGFVANCDLAEGMRIQANKKLFTLIDVSSFFVDVEVLETEIANIQIGRRAEVAVNAFPSKKFIGTVVAINPMVDPKSKTVKVTVELKDGRPNRWMGLKLRPGMFATVKLETEILPNRLLVPKEALLTRDQRNLVFTVEGGVAKWHYVEVGEENEQYVEIKSGIDVGDTVIVQGHYTLAHDARVKPTF